jgi:hypothetical protein
MVDATNEENYFTLGLFETLAEAVDAVEKCAEPSDFGSDGQHDDLFIVEIRERRIGWCGNGKAVYFQQWEQKYNEETDDYEWKITMEDFK